MSQGPWLDLILGVLHLLLALSASVHVLFHKRQPRAALLWLIVVWSAPFAGFLLYWYFGYNRILEQAEQERGSLPGPKALRTAAPLRLLGERLTGLGLRGGNRVTLLENGHHAYPEMLKAIASARIRVDLLTYIFDLDAVGERFVEALGEAVGRGVEVRVLVDGIGAWVPGNRLGRALERRGVRFVSFWRSDHLFHQPLVNLRNHRKLLVVDGRTAFAGGMNISERHHKGPLSMHPIRRLRRRRDIVRDLHFRVEGAILGDLSAAFERDWEAAGGLPPRRRLPPPRRVNGDKARMVLSGPDQRFERIYELILGALRLARREVEICTPYFIPDPPLLWMLRSLSLSGVRVRLHVPAQADHAFMGWASRAYYWELLEAGVEIWENRSGFVHSKALVIDGRWSLVGSCNLDPRSFRLNFELNIEVESVRLARELSQAMARYRADSRQVDLGLLKRQGFWASLRNHLVKLGSPYL